MKIALMLKVLPIVILATPTALFANQPENATLTASFANTPTNEFSNCDVTEVAPTCVTAYEQARSRVNQSCESQEPLCNRKGRDKIYEWNETPSYKFARVTREEKSNDACTVEIRFIKSCEVNWRCTKPEFCPF
jgi:hypothetical protein